MTSQSLNPGRRGTVLGTVIGAVLASFSSGTSALEFETENGTRVIWNTAISVGSSWRAEEPSPELFTKADGSLIGIGNDPMRTGHAARTGRRPRRQPGRQRHPQLRQGRPLLHADQAADRRRDPQGRLRSAGPRQGVVRRCARERRRASRQPAEQLQRCAPRVSARSPAGLVHTAAGRQLARAVAERRRLREGAAVLERDAARCLSLRQLRHRRNRPAAAPRPAGRQLGRERLHPGRQPDQPDRRAGGAPARAPSSRKCCCRSRWPMRTGASASARWSSSTSSNGTTPRSTPAAPTGRSPRTTSRRALASCNSATVFTNVLAAAAPRTGAPADPAARLERLRAGERPLRAAGRGRRCQRQRPVRRRVPLPGR